MNLVKYWPWPSNAVFKKLNQNFNVPSRVANAVVLIKSIFLMD